MDFRLRYGLEAKTLSSSSSMFAYTVGVHHLSGKQVPSALAIRAPGSSSIKKNEAVLRAYGFRLRGGPEAGLENPESVPEDNSSDEEVEPSGVEDLMSDLGVSVRGSPEEGFTVPKSELRKIKPGLEYEDPFRVIAGRFYADVHGETPPTVYVWPADVKRLQDQIPSNLFRWEKFGEKPPSRSLRFQDVASVPVKTDFVFRRMHWGRKLRHLALEERGKLPSSESDSEKDSEPKRHLFGSACTLVAVIKAYFKGLPDPRWTSGYSTKVYGEGYKARPVKQRSQNFIEMLRTVDGVFAQRYLAFPHEEWTWDKYDMFNLKLIWELISDMFLDGELTEYGLSITTRFDDLKKSRKWFKLCAHRNDEITAEAVHEQPFMTPFTCMWLPVWRAALREKNRTRRAYLISVLSQSRGCGKPPPVVHHRSKKEMLETVTKPVTPLGATQRRMIEMALGKVLRSLPDHIFTGLSTKARITVTTAACWEVTQSNGGTLQAIADICGPVSDIIKASIIDLYTGAVIDQKNRSDLSPGEYIFWRCLEETLRMAPEDRNNAALVAIDEPAKTRTVTKGSACVKIVLDVVNKLCMVPLEKGVPSSASGMGKANHGWNFFRESERDPAKGIIFDTVKTEIEDYAGLRQILEEYRTVYVGSTDYKTATDFLHHEIARLLGEGWMRKCGIPPILRGLVSEIAYRPRNLFYSSSNIRIGECVNPEKNLWVARSCRGVLMGDPLTKVVLHLTNIVTREIARSYNTEGFIRAVIPSHAREVQERVTEEIRTKF